MKLRFAHAVQIVFNLLMIVFAFGTYRVVSGQVHAIFLENDRTINQQKVEVIARSIRQSVLVNDLVSVRSVFQNSLKDASIKMLRLALSDGRPGICVDSDGGCGREDSGGPPIIQSRILFSAATRGGDDAGADNLGTVGVRFMSVNADRLNRVISLYLGGTLVLAIAFFNVLLWFFFRGMQRQVRWSIDAVSALTRGEPVKISRSALIEKAEFSGVIHELEGVISSYKTSVEESSRRESLYKVAEEVGHNIVSPLTAAMTEASGLPEELAARRTAIINPLRAVVDSVKRLRTKALEHNVREVASSSAAGSRPGELLSAIIEQTVSEKRSEVGTKSTIKIAFDMTEEGYGIFSNVESVELRHILSNLINNSIEANASEISLTLERADTNAIIKVTDDGSGIPEEVLPRLGQQYVTSGKPAGLGIGVHNARTKLESWGGSLVFTSKVGAGTTAEIRLLIATVPKWFAEEIRVTDGTTVVVLDDSDLVHDSWRYRFRGIGASDRGIRLVHLHGPTDLKRWLGSCAREATTLYLIDFDLGSSAECSGLDLIALYGLTDRSLLVTGRSEDPNVRGRCEALGVRMVPKELLGVLRLYRA